jgi:hypothetical protein
MSSLDDFLNAIKQQESGGNPNAVSSVGASGLYQIMPQNIGPWSQKYLGQTVSLAQYRNSPDLQERLGRAVLTDYYNQYGARGAAAAWYSGSPQSANNYTAQGNGPSIGAYVDQVLGRAGSSPQAQMSAGASQRAIDANNLTLDTSMSPVPVSPISAATPTDSATPVGLGAADGSSAVGMSAGEGSMAAPAPLTTPIATGTPTTSSTGDLAAPAPNVGAGFGSNGSDVSSGNPRNAQQAIAWARQAAASGDASWYQRCLAFVAQAGSIGHQLRHRRLHPAAAQREARRGPQPPTRCPHVLEHRWSRRPRRPLPG